MRRFPWGPRRRPLWFAVGLIVAVGACAGSINLPPGSPFLGSALPPYDGLVRHHLLNPTESGFEDVRAAAPDDDVVRLMNEGLLLHRLGRYEDSNTALQQAEAIATDRYTRSLGQELASLVVSDQVLDYQASALERSMLHFYGMLNYLALDLPESALVEARRANALLRRYANDFPGRSFVNDAAVQYVAGMLQWSEGEENDAIVSLRQSLQGYEEYEADYGVSTPLPVAVDAHRVAAAVGLDDVAERIRTNLLQGHEAEADLPARTAGSGDVLLVIENGFVAFKRQQKLFIPILRSERDSVLAGSTSSAVEAAFRVMVRTVIAMNDLSRGGQSYVQAHEDGVTLVSGALSAVGVELMTAAWPVYEPGSRRATGVVVRTGDGATWPTTLVEDLSAIAVRDFEERKTSLLLRMTGRVLLKEAGIIQSERAGERAGGAFGGFAARIAARTLANATEKADTRSWSGLPTELSIARLRLPAGTHEIEIAYRGADGPATKVLSVQVIPGAVALRSVAISGRDDQDASRLRRATADVRYEVPPRRLRSR